jgi:hypothetical protein
VSQIPNEAFGDLVTLPCRVLVRHYSNKVTSGVAVAEVVGFRACRVALAVGSTIVMATESMGNLVRKHMVDTPCKASVAGN